MEKSKKVLSLRFKVLLVIAILSFLLVMFSVIISYKSWTSLTDMQYDERAEDIAGIILSQIDVEDIDSLFIPNISEEEVETIMNSEKYQDIRKFLCDIKNFSNLQYLYIVKPIENGAYYILDTDETKTSCPLGYIDEYYEEELIYKNDFLLGNDIPSTTSSEEYGWLRTMFYPIKDSDGNMVAYICMDYLMDDIMSQRLIFLFILLITLIVITIIVVIITFIWLNQFVIKPIDTISKATKEFVNNREKKDSNLEFSAISQIDIKTHDEIEVLSNAIKTMEIDINKYIENITLITTERERIGAELNVATQIQADMLPRIFPAFPERDEFDIYATMTPAKEVGGDFYDFFLIDDDHLAIVIADVSGKGVPAALFMVIAKTLIKNQAQTKLKPSDVFTKVNQQLCEGNEAGLFVTAWLGVLELSTGKLNYVNAGHNPPLIKNSNGNFKYLKSRAGFVLAGMENIKYRQFEIQLSHGDIIYLYTDGVTEATNENFELYGENRLLDIMNHNINKNVIDILNLIKSDIDLFVGNAPQFDDITMLCLKYNGGKIGDTIE